MKKLSLLLIGALLLAGCKQTQPTAQVQTQTQEQAMDGFSKVAGAIQAGKPVSCTLTKTDGGSTMTYVMMGKKVKISGMMQANESNSSMLSDGTYIYTWDTAKKTGIKMKAPSEEDVNAIAEKNGQNVPALSSEADKKKYEDEGYRVDCQETTASESDFVPPTDVKFTDASAMMDQVGTMMKTNPSEMTPEQQKALEEQTKEMMKQYGQPDTQQ